MFLQTWRNDLILEASITLTNGWGVSIPRKSLYSLIVFSFIIFSITVDFIVFTQIYKISSGDLFQPVIIIRETVIYTLWNFRIARNFASWKNK